MAKRQAGRLLPRLQRLPSPSLGKNNAAGASPNPVHHMLVLELKDDFARWLFELRTKPLGLIMHEIIYLIGLIVVVMFVLGTLGLR